MKVRSGAKAPHTLKPARQALRYAANGCRILPMHTVRGTKCSCHRGAKCENPGKHPLTPHGVKDATKNPKVIKQWWRSCPNANVGIAAGKISNIIVLDIDPRNGGMETLQSLEIELGKLPDTLTSKTGGGGRHLVFAYPAVRVRKDSAGKLLGPGIDVLSDGSIMIAPPSRHRAGAQYKWINGKFNTRKPAVLPEKWLIKITRSTNTEETKALMMVISEGERNASLTSLAGMMQRSGASAKAILAALLAENTTKCRPPLDSSEVKKIVRSVSRYPASAPGERSDAAEKLLQLVLNGHFQGGTCLAFGADGRFWHYSGKVWSVASDQWIDGRILESIQNAAIRSSQQTASLIRQVRVLLQAQLAVKGDPFAFVDEPPRVINCSNGEVWIADDGTIELRPHNPKSYLRHLLDVSYDPEAKCPQYNKALLEIFSKTEVPKAMRRHWHELVGYLIQPRRNIPLIAVLLGPGANGKTVLVRTIVKLIGPAQAHTQRVEELDKNRFAVGSLLGKLLFIDDDVRAGARLPDGTLKMISEAKEVTGENKYKPQFNFVVRTVPMLLCNNVPSLADVSHGMMRRLMVIPFDRTFTMEDKDEGLFERIWANELPGVLNKALQGHSRLIKRGGFRIPSAIRKATDDWLKQANPLPAFMDECCVLNPDGKCLVDDLYPAYTNWAARAGITLTQSRLAFTRNLEHLGHKKGRSTGGYLAIAGLELRS